MLNIFYNSFVGRKCLFNSLKKATDRILKKGANRIVVSEFDLQSHYCDHFRINSQSIILKSDHSDKIKPDFFQAVAVSV